MRDEVDVFLEQAQKLDLVELVSASVTLLGMRFAEAGYTPEQVAQWSDGIASTIKRAFAGAETLLASRQGQ